MLYWAAVFLIIAIGAAALGSPETAAAAVVIARVLFEERRPPSA